MLTITMPVTISAYSGETTSSGEYVDVQRKEVFGYLQRSVALGFEAKGTFQQLNEVFEESSEQGWDGGHAKPVTQEVVQIVKSFLQSFPLGIEAPEIGAEPDGAITLEWYRSSNRVISISINPGGLLYYAAIIGAARRHGMDCALSDVSGDILALIIEVTRKI